MSRKQKISRISLLHFFKLISRSATFLIALVMYIVSRARGSRFFLTDVKEHAVILAIIALVFLGEMILRFFPSRFESMGCQKQFARNYIPRTPEAEPKSTALSTLSVALVWLALNGAIGAIYYLGWIDEGILILISLFYSVCDMICILYFCPFQTWMMKNKCCGSCRIYNWDYAMMFTPLVFIPHFYTRGLLGIALLLLLVWEIAAHVHPERFRTETNECLSCTHCKEKLCHHKKQLRHFLRKNKELLLLKGNAVAEKVKNLTKK